MDFLENVDIDKGILQNIDIDKISYRLEFGISNRAREASSHPFQVEAPLDNSVSCEMCEFAVTVIDERLDDEATIDQVLISRMN